MGNFKRMMEVSSPLYERVDYLDLATTLVKQYGLKSKVKFGSGKDFGEYLLRMNS